MEIWSAGSDLFSVLSVSVFSVTVVSAIAAHWGLGERAMLTETRMR
jgi:hypothetical protein